MGENRLRVAGLFAGIGGLELGLARAGHHAELLCEIEPGAVAVLKSRFPGVRLHEDVTTLDRLPAGTDLVVAGFPCQDLSQAGLTKGLGGRQSSLVDHVFRLLGSSDVPWVLLENVPFMLQLGRGGTMRHVATELERLGYSWAYRVVDTRAFGLPQRRERVFILASKLGSPAAALLEPEFAPPEQAYTEGVACGFYWTEGLRGLGWGVDCVPTLKGGSTIGIPSPPAIWTPEGAFVTPDIRDAERLQGFDVDWTQPAETVGRASHRWKLVGNAVSVPVAEWLGGRIGVSSTWAPIDPSPFNPGGAWPRAGFLRGGDVWTVPVSTWPVCMPAPSLLDFLHHPTRPMSLRGLEGFKSRLDRGSLKRPAAFDRDLERAIDAASVAAGSSARDAAVVKARSGGATPAASRRRKAAAAVVDQ